MPESYLKAKSTSSLIAYIGVCKQNRINTDFVTDRAAILKI